MLDLTVGEVISGLSDDGREVRSTVFNENEVRVAAGPHDDRGAVAFVYANFEKKVFVPIRIVTIVFSLEFLIRLTVGRSTARPALCRAG